MTEGERQLLIAVARAVLAMTATRHTGHDEDLAALIDAVTAPPEPEPAA